MIDAPATPQQVANALGVNRTKIARFIKSGQLKAVDLSLPGSKRPRYRILPTDLEAFLDSRKTTAPAKRERNKASDEMDEIKEYV